MTAPQIPQSESIRDISHDQLFQRLSQIDVDARLRAADREAIEIADGVFGKSSRTRTLPPDTATPLLAQFQERLAARIQADAGRFSAYRWLWFSRRLPDGLFEGQFLSSAGYRRGLFETVTALRASNVVDATADQDATFFEYDDSTLRHLIRVVGLARILAIVHVDLRWVGKGASLHLPPYALPRASPGTELREAAELYDRRNEGAAQHFTGLGTVMASTPGAHDFRLGGAYRVANSSPVVIREPDPVAGFRKYVTEGRYAPAIIHFSGVLQLLADARIAGVLTWSLILRALLVVMRLSLLVETLAGAREQASVLQNGYFAVHRESLFSLLEELIPSINAELAMMALDLRVSETPAQVVQTIESAGASVWPLRVGPVLTATPLGFVVDVSNSTNRLFRELEYPNVTGDAANVRAEHFETSVQRMIDWTHWKASDSLGAIQGRSLRLDGIDLSDIDALGENGGTLLLVSCKSIPYSGRYDAGDFRTIRNTASTVTEAVARWSAFVTILTEHPRGDNYDFSRYKEIVGVVCTPHVMYVPIGAATREVRPGLRAAVSAVELADWVVRAQAP